MARTRVGGVQQSCKRSFRWGKLAPQAKILGPFFNPISHNFATAGLSQRAPTFARGGSTRTQTALPVGPLQHMGPAGSEDAWCTSEAWCRVFGVDRSPKQLHGLPAFQACQHLDDEDRHTQTAAGRATAAHGPSRQRGCLVHIGSLMPRIWSRPLAQAAPRLARLSSLPASSALLRSPVSCVSSAGSERIAAPCR